MNIIIGTIAVIALIAALIYSRRAFGVTLAPPAVMVIPWAVAVLLLQVPLLNYTGEINASVGIFACALASFVLGCGLAWIFWFKGRVRWVPINATVREVQVVVRAGRVAVALGAIGAFSYYWQFNRAFGLSLLIEDVNQVRHLESFGTVRETIGNPLMILMVFVVPGVALCFASAFFCRGRDKIYQIGLAIIGLFVLSLNSGRTALFSGLVVSTAMLYYCSKVFVIDRRLLRKLSIVGIVMLVFFIVHFNASSSRMSKNLADSDYIVLGPTISKYMTWSIGPYHYLVGPLVAFNELKESNVSDETNGNLTFGAFSRVAHQLWPAHFKYPRYVSDFVYIPVPTNVYTYLDAFLYDYGWPGVYVLPLFWGLVAMSSFCALIRQRSFFYAFVASVFAYCCISSIGVNRFGTLEIWLWICGIAVIYAIAHLSLGVTPSARAR